MQYQTDKLTPLEQAQTFATKMLLSAALSETLKEAVKLQLESQQLLKGLRESEGSEKDKLQALLSKNIKDRKFLFEACFLNPVERNV